MNVDPSSLTVTGVIATALSVVFAMAAFMNAKRRTKMRQVAESAMMAEAGSAIRDAAPSLPASATQARPIVVTPPPAPTPVLSKPGLVPMPAFPPSPVLTAPTPPPAPPPPPPPSAPLFKQYVTRPGMKSTTPTADTPATEKDYVWE